ncbi:MAG: hypothetical protein IKP87_03185, partial [Victivallales bacterium]|nr:hypothetical protein [Victivallales bacterium]
MHGKGGPAINPGTVELHMPQAFCETPVINKKMVRTGVFVHALGGITKHGENSVELNLWPSKETDVLVSGLDMDVPVADENAEIPKVKWQGKPIDVKWIEKHRTFIVSLKGEGLLEW